MLRRAFVSFSVLTLLGAFAGDASAAQSQASLTINAQVVVSSSISATPISTGAPRPAAAATAAATMAVSQPTAATTATLQNDNGQSEPTPAEVTANGSSEMAPGDDDAAVPSRDSNRSLCTSVAVSCSGASPIRISASGEPTSPEGQCGPLDRGQSKTVALCGGDSGNSESIGVTIEY